MGYISGVLKTRKAGSCSLQVSDKVYKFLIKNPIKNHFLEIFCKFQSTFKKFGWEFVLVSLQTVYC